MKLSRSVKNRLFLVLTSLVFLLSVLMIFPFETDKNKDKPSLSSAAAAANQNYRGYTEYTLPSAPANGGITAGILRQTVMYVYAKAGETICLGSDICDSIIYFDENGNEVSDPDFKTHEEDIVLIRPDGQITTYDTEPLGKGFINTLAQEKAGPNYDGNNPNGYTPHKYPVEQDGVYEIRFRSFSGDRNVYSPYLCGTEGPTEEAAPHRNTELKNEPTSAYVTAEKWLNSSVTVGSWDITVVDENEPNPDQRIKKGRAYTNCLCLNIGSNNRYFSQDYYVVTSDGYIYKTSFNEIDPFGFVFFSNNRGLLSNDTNTSEYHSFQTKSNDLADLYTTQNVSFHSPTNKDTEIDKTFRIFFEEPDSELVGTLYPKAYVPDQITDIEFVGSKVDNISYVEDGGYFKFKVSRSTSATLKISFDEYNQLNGTDFQPVYITENVFAGDNYFLWDGCDGTGQVIPEGVYYHGIEVSLTNHSGEYHFPLLDAESCNGNITVERVNNIYERVIDEDGVITDVDVTYKFEDQKFNLYYNNQIIPNETEIPNNSLITDPKVIEQLKKYSVPIVSKALADGSPEQRILSDSSDIEIKAARVFNLEQTKKNNKLMSEEEILSCFEEYKNDYSLYTDNLYFDYYPLIADQNDYSEGVDSSGGNAMKFTERAGDFTAIDIWTYSLGLPSKFLLQRPIIIEDIDSYRHSNIRGRVFFDKNNNGKYEISSGDYGISGVKVTADYTYTETRWDPQYDEQGNIISYKCYDSKEYEDADGNPVLAVLVNYLLEPTGTENIYYLKSNDEYVTDENGDPKEFTLRQVVKGDEETGFITHYFVDIPVHMETVTDQSGFYKFTGITMLEGSEDLGNISIKIERPSEYYTLTTTNKKTGVFGTKGTEEQLLSLQTLYDLSENAGSMVFFDDADVGYFYEEYEPPIKLQKIWAADVSSDPNRPDSMIFHIIAVDYENIKEPYEYTDDEILYQQDVTLNYFNNSWSKTMEHLPAKFGDRQLKYLIQYEKFVKNGVTYIFDGQGYKDVDGNEITDVPYNSKIEPTIVNYTGHILSISNIPTNKSIEITKRDDNDRGKLVAGAVFKLERYNDEDDSWEYVTSSKTNSFGLLSYKDVEVGRYKITETSAPDLYGLIEPFEIVVTDEQQVYKKTIYEPLSNVKLSVKKEFGKTPDANQYYLSIPDQTLSYKVELAYDEDFTNKLSAVYEFSFKTKSKQEPIDLFKDLVIPNCDASKDVYIRITESGAGAYSLTATADAYGNMTEYHYDVNGSKMSVDNNTKTVILKMQHGEDELGFSEYTVTLKNTLEYAGSLRFQKRWYTDDTLAVSVNPNNNTVKVKNDGVEVEVLAIYAKLMRVKKVGDDYIDPEVVISSLKAANGANKVEERYNGSAYNDKTLVEGEHCFTMKASDGWSKNCTAIDYFYLPTRSPEGFEYRYYIEEVTNEYGNPYVVLKDSTEPSVLTDFKVLTSDKYTEHLNASSNGTITGVTIDYNGGQVNYLNYKDASPPKNPNINYQKNYFLLNYSSTDLALQITKNQLRDVNSEPDDTLPLADAEFTLFSDEACTIPVDTIKTGEDGIGKFKKQFSVGTVYYLKETRAPTGYMIDPSVRRIEYEYTDAKRLKISLVGSEEGAFELKDDDKDGIVNITLTNSMNLTLPDTGAFFTALNSSTLGILLMAIAVMAACIYLRSLRKKSLATNQKQ